MTCCACSCAVPARFGLSVALVTAAISVVGAWTHLGTDRSPEPPAKPTAPAASDRYVLGFTMKSIDDKEVNLADYKGKVVLMVNVASKCGYTPQYEGLQKLYAAYKDKGFVILGFPANNFGAQEPGSNEEIAKFCQSKYSVTFPMFAKISVKGDDQHPLYKKLSGQPAPLGGDPKWNFTKFLVDRSGNVTGRFESSVRPDDKDLKAKIEEALAGAADKPADTKPAEAPKPEAKPEAGKPK